MRVAQRTIYLFRHGETDWNVQGRFQGHLDIPLNDTGRTQALELLGPLRGRGIEAILSSDLSRTRETAQILAQQLHVPVFTHAGLREANLGRAQGLTHQEMTEKFGVNLLAKWRSSLPSDADIRFPEGETGHEIISRALGALREFCSRFPYSTIGVSSHGGVLRRLLHLVIPASEQIEIPNSVIYAFQFDPDARTLSGGLSQIVRLR